VTHFEFMDRLNDENRVLNGADSEDFVILACAILIRQQGVSDTQTEAFAITKIEHLHNAMYNLYNNMNDANLKAVHIDI